MRKSPDRYPSTRRDPSGLQFRVRAPHHSQSRDRLPETIVLPPNLVVRKTGDNCGDTTSSPSPQEVVAELPISVVSIRIWKKVLSCEFQHRDFYPLRA